MLEDLHLLKHRLVVTKAERPDHTAGAQLAFDGLLVQTEGLEKVLDGARPGFDAGSDAPEEPSTSPPPARGKSRPRTGAPPTGRRDLDKLDLPIVGVEIPDPELEGKAKSIGVEEHSRVGYERGGDRRVIITRVVYKVTDESLRADSGPAEGADEALDPAKTPPKEVGCLAHARRKYWEAAMCRHPIGLEGGSITSILHGLSEVYVGGDPYISAPHALVNAPAAEE